MSITQAHTIPDENKVDIIADSFENQLREIFLSNEDIEHKVEQQIARLQSFSINCPNLTTTKEVIKIIKQLKKRKASGKKGSQT